MIGLLSIGTAIVAATVVFHVLGLTLLSGLLKCLAGRPLGQGTSHHGGVPRYRGAGPPGHTHHRSMVLGRVYLALGEFRALETALYFSVVTATTLGYGELVLSERWRLLSTFEAMGGLMLVGVSAAYVTLSVHRDADSDSGLGRCGVEAATLIARCRSHD